MSDNAKPQLYRFKDERKNDGKVYEIESRLPEGQIVLRPYPYPNTARLVASLIVAPTEIEPVKD